MRPSRALLDRALTFRRLPRLADATLKTFRANAFEAGVPRLLPRSVFAELPAVSQWFRSPETPSSPANLNLDALRSFGEAPVQTELSSPDSTGPEGRISAFARHEAPLHLFLSWATYAQDVSPEDAAAGTRRLYLAQSPLSLLPSGMQAALPTPELVRHAGRGDVYAASLWLGVAPTVTPLHRDGNPNLLVQLAGRKVVRILHPDMGKDVWVRHGGREGGEGMMQGVERERLETAMWGGGEGTASGELEESKGDEGDEADGWECELETGDALFIPTGWWHAVHGVGRGVTASVNWWFR